MGNTQAPLENPLGNESSVDEKLTIAKSGPIQLQENPGDIRVVGPLLKKFVEADSPTKKYYAGLELQEELIKGMKLEKKTFLGKIFKNKFTKTALLVGAGALIPSVVGIASGTGVPSWMTSVWEGTKTAGGAVAGIIPKSVNDAAGSTGEYVKSLWGEMPLSSKIAFGAAGGALAAAGIYKVGQRLISGNIHARNERKLWLKMLRDERGKFDKGQVRIRKDFT